MSEIIQLAVVEEILDTTVEALAHWHVLPLIVRRIELLYIETTYLQRCIHIQVLVERRYCTRSLTTSVVEFRRASILQLRYLRGFAVVDDELYSL